MIDAARLAVDEIAGIKRSVVHFQLNPSRWPIYCDHSVTSADVRLSVGRTIKREHLKEDKRIEANP
jgi:hypothetical protein